MNYSKEGGKIMAFSRKRLALLAGAVLLIPAFMHLRARGSDHADTPTIAATPGADLTDVYIFPSPTGDATKVVLVMNVHPLIPSGQGPSVVFDPNVLYQFKIDNVGDFKEHLVIQAKFTGTDANQQVQIAGPVKPSMTGTQSVFETPDSVVGKINDLNFTTSNGMHVFAGAREDPFFFDLNQFFTILPDRASPLGSTFNNTSGATVSTAPADPDLPQAASWRPVGQAQDFLKGLDVLSIVVELPRALLTAGGDGKIRVWCTTSM
jgi:hypothetical protein